MRGAAMGDVIDFTEQKRKILEKFQCEIHDLTPEENAAITEIQERITEKYLLAQKLRPAPIPFRPYSFYAVFSFRFFVPYSTSPVSFKGLQYAA